LIIFFIGWRKTSHIGSAFMVDVRWVNLNFIINGHLKPTIKNT